MKRREEMTFLERIYVVEIAKGLRVTFGKLLGNLWLHVLQALGRRTGAAGEWRFNTQTFDDRIQRGIEGAIDLRCTITGISNAPHVFCARRRAQPSVFTLRLVSTRIRT
jgi:hypothetical protein